MALVPMHKRPRDDMLKYLRAPCEHDESHTPIFSEDSALKCYSSTKASAMRGFLVLYRQMESKEVAGPSDSAAPCMSLNGLT